MAGMLIEGSQPSTSPVTGYASKLSTVLYFAALPYIFISESVFGKTPSSHSEAYTALACECQKIAACGLNSATKLRNAAASGSEDASVPALTFLPRHELSGCHLQAKFRLRSTLFALKRAAAKSVSAGSAARSASVTLPSF